MDYKTGSTSNLRETEYFTLATDHTTAVVSIQAEQEFEHEMRFLFTILIVVMLLGMTYSITDSIRKLVVKPIEKMTRIVQEFTNNVCLLAPDIVKSYILFSLFFNILFLFFFLFLDMFDVAAPKLSKKKVKNYAVKAGFSNDLFVVYVKHDQNKIVEELLETDIVEAAIDTMSAIFSQIHTQRNPDTISEEGFKRNEKQSFLSALPASKNATTIFRSKHSVLQINVQEQKKPTVDEKTIAKEINLLKKSGDMDAFHAVNIQEKEELQSVQVFCKFFIQIFFVFFLQHRSSMTSVVFQNTFLSHVLYM